MYQEDFLRLEDLPRDGRTVIGQNIFGEPDVKIIKGQEEEYPNLNDVYTYTSNFSELMSIVDDIAEEKDGAEDMYRYLRMPMKLSLIPGGLRDGDENGQIYSRVESAVLSRYAFEGFVQPSRGTIFRLLKVAEKRYAEKKIKVHFILPYGYPDCSPEEKHSFDDYRQSVVSACATCKFRFKFVDTTWEDLGRGFYYYASNGHMLHKSKFKGVGLELNPNVAVTMNKSILRFREDHNVITVCYVKNMREYEFDYLKVPVAYRFHGDMFATSQGFAAVSLNLFNVVSTNGENMYEAHEIKDERFFHCAERMITNKIDSIVEQLYRGIHVRVGIDSGGLAVRVLSPQLELSSSVKVCRELGYDLSEFTGPTACILSTVSAKYYVVDAERIGQKGFNPVMFDIPSVWRFERDEWKVKFYPNSVRLGRLSNSKQKKKCDINYQYFDENGAGLVPSNQGKWYNIVDNVCVLIVKESFMDDNLFYSGKNFVEAGNVTVIYEEGTQVLLSMETHKVNVDRSYVSVLKRFVNNSFVKENLKDWTEYNDCYVKEFENTECARAWYYMNKEMYLSRIWLSDITHNYAFNVPKRGNLMLTKKIIQIDCGLYLTKMPLATLFSATCQYDENGYYYFSSAAFDKDNDISDIIFEDNNLN